MVASLRNMSKANLIAQAAIDTPGRPEMAGMTKKEILAILLQTKPVADGDNTVITSGNKIVNIAPVDPAIIAVIDEVDTEFATLGAYDPTDSAILQRYIMVNVLGKLAGLATSFGPNDDGTYQLRVEGTDLSIGWIFKS